MEDLVNKLTQELSNKTNHILDAEIIKALKNKGLLTDDFFFLSQRGEIVVMPDGTNTLIVDKTIPV